MTQHIEHFLRATTTVTVDGSLVSIDELEGLYVYWCSLNDQEAAETSDVVAVLRSQGVETTSHEGMDYVEGLVLTGSLVTDFILSCEFSGAWGIPFVHELASAPEVATAS